MTATTPRRAKPHQRYYLKSGQEVVGVTTALGVLNKRALIGWANKIGLQGIKVHEYVDDLADVGTCAHYLVQCHLAGQKPDLQDFTPRQADRAENCLISFFEWARDKTFETAYSEQQLVSEEYSYGGTVDWYGTINGRHAVIDIKTGKTLYDENNYQIAAYAQLLKENGHSVDEARLLQIGRDESEGFQEKMFPASALIPFFNVFETCLALYNAIKVARRK